MNTLINLNDINFSEYMTKEEDLIIFNFVTEWCGPCKMLTLILETISQEENIKVFKIDVDENPNLTSIFKITSVPVTIFLDKGKEICQFKGIKSKEELKEKLKELR